VAGAAVGSLGLFRRDPDPARPLDPDATRKPTGETP